MSVVRSILKKVVKQYPKNLYWSVYGPLLFNEHFPDRVKSIHFVCKGNICRSAFAHMMGLKMFCDLKGEEVLISSSGLVVNLPEFSPEEAKKIAEVQFGISLRTHKSIPLSADIFKNEDIIIVMEGWQLREVRKRYPDNKNKVFLLSQFESNHRRIGIGYELYNVLDPYGKGDEAFLNCFLRIERCLNGLKKRIM